MSEKKEKPPAPEGTGDNVNEEIARLRADNARLLASQTLVGHPSWTTDDEVKQLLSFPTTHPAHQRPLPPMKYIALQSSSCHSCAIFLASIGTRSTEYRLIKYDMPPWLDATRGPALRFQPDAQHRVDVDTMSGWGVDRAMQAEILKCERGDEYQHDPTRPLEHIAAATAAFFGKGKIAHHNRIHRLKLPIDRLAGLVESEARRFCRPDRFEDIPEGAPLPSWWDEALRATGEDVIVFEALAPTSKTYGPRSEKDDAPRIIGKPDAGYPGRY